MLFPTPELSSLDHLILEELERMRSDLRYQIRQVPIKWTEGLRKFLTADAVAASNSIEGFRVSTVDVVDLMEGERDVEVSEDNREETLAYQRMMTYIQTLHNAGDFSFSKGLLNALHWILQGHHHTVAKPAGQWRGGPVYVTDPRDPSIAADGNGRMSRSLQTLMIAREGVLAPEFSSIEAWLGRPGNTWEYYRELNARGSHYLPDQDVSSWIRFNLTAYHQQAQTVRNRLSRSGRVLELLTDFTASKGLDERLVSALHEVAMTGRVRRLRYEHAEGLSVQQAQRDLRDLTASGILESVGRTRARYYTAGPDFPEPVLTTATTPASLTDPYRS